MVLSISQNSRSFSLSPILTKFFKKDTLSKMFSREFSKIFNKTFFIEQLRVGDVFIIKHLCIYLSVFWCLYLKIWTYFYVFELKGKTFAEFSLSEGSSFSFKQNKQLFYYKRTALHCYLKIPEHLSGVISHNSSEWYLLKVLKRTKTCSKSR